MKKRIFLLALTLTLLIALVLPALPVSADKPDKLDRAPAGKIERLPPGWERLNSHTKARTVGIEMRDGKKFATVEAEIDSLPTTLDDNKTLIDTNWYLLTDDSGQVWFQNGVNLFTAKVLGGRVSVEDGDGKLSVWNSTLSVGSDTFGGGTPKIADDPINPEYKGNCLLWEYGSYGGWWIFGGSDNVKRYLRVIEGHISELWILPEDPKTTVIVNLNETVERGYDADITWLNAYDAKGKSLRVTKSKFGSYIINAAEFSGVEYPVTIDPTTSFVTSSYDGDIFNLDATWNGVRTDAVGHWVYLDNAIAWDVGTIDGILAIGAYEIARGVVYFNTASLPDDAVFSYAALGLVGWHYYYYPNVDFYIVVQTGMPTYPHMPAVVADYNYTYYSGNGGQFWTGGWVDDSITYNTIVLNSTGMGWINKTGWTKFMLRSSHDIDSIPPTNEDANIVRIRPYEYGAGTAPKLTVTYSIPIDPPTVTTRPASAVSETSATLEGGLADDGGEACSVRFQYGTTTSYGNTTTYQSGKITGTYFEQPVYGLSPGTVYHYIAQAMNSTPPTQSGSDVTFSTLPNAPYDFTATPGDGTVALAWTKGTGADKTMVRRATSSYPETPTDGTQIYFDTGNSHDDNTAINGTTYYYRIWSWANSIYSASYANDTALPAGPVLGSVTTMEANEVEPTTATFNSNADDMGGSAHVHLQFQYYWGAGAWPDNTTALSGEVGLGHYSIGVVGLPAATLIHVRAVIVNDTGTAYGTDMPFTTGANSAPTMDTTAATGEQLFSAILNGAVTDDGGELVTAHFRYGLTTNYEMGSTPPSPPNLETGNTFYYGLDNLTPNTTYHYMIVGENAIGIAYGDDVTFTTTTPAVPTVRTDVASEIGANQALLNLTVVTDGGVECEVQFQWSTTGAYGGEEIDTGWVEGFTEDQVYNKLITDLTIGETYHFRGQVKNVGGTDSGDDVIFTTVFGAPVDFRAKAVSSTTINLSWLRQGDQTHVRYSKDSYPVDRGSDVGTLVYFGTDEYTSISGLIAGTTYYFRAWSWREGDVWADTTADDVATTQATVPMGEEEESELVLAPVEPETWFQTPSGAAITKMPFYAQIEALADDYEIPSGSMWLAIALLITIVAAILAFGTVHNAFIAIAAGGLAIVTCSALGMAPLWFIAIYAALGGGVVYVTTRL